MNEPKKKQLLFNIGSQKEIFHLYDQQCIMAISSKTTFSSCFALRYSYV